MAGATPDVFDELLHALNPYIDELTWEPTFHQFEDLPIELRYKVYEQYFLDHDKTLSCTEATWQLSGQRYIFKLIHMTRSPRKSVPFLPTLFFGQSKS